MKSMCPSLGKKARAGVLDVLLLESGERHLVSCKHLPQWEELLHYRRLPCASERLTNQERNVGGKTLCKKPPSNPAQPDSIV